MDKQAIGDRIKMLRERKRWTQGDLAAAARQHAPQGKHYYHCGLTGKHS